MRDIWICYIHDRRPPEGAGATRDCANTLPVAVRRLISVVATRQLPAPAPSDCSIDLSFTVEVTKQDMKDGGICTGAHRSYCTVALKTLIDLEIFVCVSG